MRQETELLIVDDNSNDGSQATVAALQSEVAPSSTLACLLLPAHAEAEKRVSCGIALMPQHSCPPVSNLAYPYRVASIHCQYPPPSVFADTWGEVKTLNLALCFVFAVGVGDKVHNGSSCEAL